MTTDCVSVEDGIKLIGSLKVKLINKSPASFPTGEG
jgi:hypothetical protein